MTEKKKGFAFNRTFINSLCWLKLCADQFICILAKTMEMKLNTPSFAKTTANIDSDVL